MGGSGPAVPAGLSGSYRRPARHSQFYWGAIRLGSGESKSRPLSSSGTTAPSIIGTTSAPQVGVDPYAALQRSAKMHV